MPTLDSYTRNRYSYQYLHSTPYPTTTMMEGIQLHVQLYILSTPRTNTSVLRVASALMSQICSKWDIHIPDSRKEEEESTPRLVSGLIVLILCLRSKNPFVFFFLHIQEVLICYHRGVKYALLFRPPFFFPSFESILASAVCLT